MAKGIPAPGKYTLDPEGTTISADCKAMFGLLTVHGTFLLRSGEVTIAEDPASSTVNAVIDAGSYASGNDRRDRDVISPRFLDAKAHPDITFSGEGARADGGGWVVAGTLTARGTPAPAEIRVTGASGGLPASLRATASLDRNAFGVTSSKGMVGKAVQVIVDAALRPA